MDIFGQTLQIPEANLYQCQTSDAQYPTCITTVLTTVTYILCNQFHRGIENSLPCQVILLKPPESRRHGKYKDLLSNNILLSSSLLSWYPRTHVNKGLLSLQLNVANVTKIIKSPVLTCQSHIGFRNAPIKYYPDAIFSSPCVRSPFLQSFHWKHRPLFPTLHLKVKKQRVSLINFPTLLIAVVNERERKVSNTQSNDDMAADKDRWGAAAAPCDKTVSHIPRQPMSVTHDVRVWAGAGVLSVVVSEVVTTQTMADCQPDNLSIKYTNFEQGRDTGGGGGEEVSRLACAVTVGYRTERASYQHGTRQRKTPVSHSRPHRRHGYDTGGPDYKNCPDYRSLDYTCNGKPRQEI
ncbi:hypothetical protein J6590_077152 [Homalodisca vitripennis]|nr:hypothetical protein J6590_077152 [Homalodisca vitripennis]